VIQSAHFVSTKYFEKHVVEKYYFGIFDAIYATGNFLFGGNLIADRGRCACCNVEAKK